MEQANVFHDRQARGRTRTGWLQSFHTFSFGSFNDPTRMGFRALRVINEDIVAGGSGFSEHGHEHFEILTFLLAGRIEHRDSQGNAGTLEAGDLQSISAGTGIRHSERNPDPDAPAHLFQIWLHGNADQDPPRYQQARGALLPQAGAPLRLVASGDAKAGGLLLRAPVSVWCGQLQAQQAWDHVVVPGRYGWLQCLEGVLQAQEPESGEAFELRGGDALQLGTPLRLQLTALTPVRWLWFDLA